MDILKNILRYIWPVLPIILAAFLPMLINLKKEKRYLQFALPLVALIYGIIYMVEIDDISVYLLSKMYQIIDYLSTLVDRFAFMEDVVGFLKGINWSFGIMYVTNFIMLFAFLLIKSLVLPFLRLFHPENGKLIKTVIGLFYEYDEDDKQWYIKEKLSHAKRILMAVNIGVIIFSCLLFALTCFLVSKETFSAPFYPIFGILIFNECHFFLSGVPKGGDDVTVIDDEEDPVEEIDYSTLKEMYEEYFSDRLSAVADLPPVESKNISVVQLLEHYREDAAEGDSQESRLFYKYFLQLANNGVELDDGMIVAARSIMEGKSVLFNTPFYEDTTRYVFLPIIRCLMQNKKILVIVGRTGADQSLINWIRKGISGINGFDNIWKIAYLDDCKSDTQIAILPMKDIYNQKMIAQNANFLKDTHLAIITDPTRLLGTMQVGLSNVVSYLRCGVSTQYIAYDRNCDGLVDSLSHVLNCSIQDVAATVVGSAKGTAMIWDADGKNLHHRLGLDTARYLGVGAELGALAVLNKVPQVNWFAYEKFPANDIKWIISQYYGPLCKVMDIPVSQAELEKHLVVSPDLWSMAIKENRFIIAEDEYNNPYEIIRQFSSRASKQAFVNVISQNYLLREYMSGNAEIFTYDPKAIPSFVADYQRVRSNTVYKIVMRLINGEIYEEEIKDSLELIGIESQDVHRDISDLISSCFIPNDSGEQYSVDSIINVKYELVINRKTRRPERKRVYSITNALFIERFFLQLRVVPYIAEDEQDKNHYMNSILYGHVYQKYLPGTFTVFDGKHYEVVSITPTLGMVVRRAADHITSRRYYRQLRTYTLNDFGVSDELAAVTTFGNIQVERGEARIQVATDGYLEQKDYGDLKNVNRVVISGVPKRCYNRKNVLRFKLGGADEKVRFTVTTMINELFVTLFPEMHEYIVATTFAQTKEMTDGYMPYLVFGEGFDQKDKPDEYIYIIEDSLIDLGLSITVERYLKRILEIITDLLCWHKEQMEAPQELEDGDEGDDGYSDGNGEENGDDLSKNPGCLFGLVRRKKKGDTSEEGVPEEGTPEESPSDESKPEESKTSFSFNRKDKDFDVISDNESEIDGEDEESIDVVDGKNDAFEPVERKPYAERHFMLYGYESVPQVFALEETLKYLEDNGFSDNYLKQTRDSAKKSKLKWYNHRFEPGEHYCDFCGAKLEGKFSILEDGRERCNECKETAITKVKDFKKLYKQTHRRMEEVFGIKIHSKIKIRMTNAQEIAQECGYEFKPSPQFDGRALGFAQRLGNGKTRIVLENGSPKIETEKTLVHELTHVWQYENMACLWEPKDLVAIEGMAVWTEAQYLICNGMEERSAAYVESRKCEDSEYGQGMREYTDKYPLKKGTKAPGNSPFKHAGRNPLR